MDIHKYLMNFNSFMANQQIFSSLQWQKSMLIVNNDNFDVEFLKIKRSLGTLFKDTYQIL